MRVNIFDVNRERSNQRRNASGILNSSKDDDNSNSNWSTFALKVIPNSYNFNPLFLMLIPSIFIGIGYNSAENYFLKNLMITCGNALKICKYVLVSLKMYGKVRNSTSGNLLWVTFSKIFLIDSALTIPKPFTWTKPRNLNSWSRVWVHASISSEKDYLWFKFWPKY